MYNNKILTGFIFWEDLLFSRQLWCKFLVQVKFSQDFQSFVRLKNQKPVKKSKIGLLYCVYLHIVISVLKKLTHKNNRQKRGGTRQKLWEKSSTGLKMLEKDLTDKTSSQILNPDKNWSECFGENEPIIERAELGGRRMEKAGLL